MSEDSKHPLTILQVLPSLDSGGVERGTVEIASYLASQGHRALVASAGGRLVAELEAAGATHFTLPLKSKNPLTIWANIARLERLIRENKVDVVHARSRAPAWSAYFAAKRAGVPFLTTFHAAYKNDFVGKHTYNSVMVKGERIIAISDFIRRHIQQEYAVPDEKITLIHRGADMQKFNPRLATRERVEALRQQWQLPAGVPLVVCPGRISRIKGQDVLIEALAELRDLPWHLVIAGSDQGRSNITENLKKMAADLGIAERISFVGDYKGDPAAFSLGDIIVAASLVPEAFGRVLAEAQAMERLIISSNIGATSEIIQHGQTGWLVPPDDPDALAAVLREFFALSPNERRSRELKAAQSARSQFDTAIMCAKTLEVYQQLAA